MLRRDRASAPKMQYQNWPGKNRFYCQGRFISGSNLKTFFLTIFLIIGITVGFAGFVAIKFHPIVVVLYLLGISFSLWSLLTTAFMDPGIIPRNLSAQSPEPPDVKDASRIKYCSTCKMYRDCRAKHCRFCDNCVLKFDHHCPWIGNCIGLRNYRFFLMFVYSIMGNAAYAITFCVIDIVKEVTNSSEASAVGESLGDVIIDALPSIILLAAILIVALSVLPLSCYHYQLIWRGETTNENPNPYNKGCLGNLFEACCTEIPPSILRLREPVGVSEVLTSPEVALTPVEK